MAQSRFKVLPYTPETLKRICIEQTPISPNGLERKCHFNAYFPKYFTDIKPKPRTIVVEYEYIDRDFMEDYAGFYVRCFNPPIRECARLHFFSQEFSEDDFNNLLSGTNDSLCHRLTQPDAYLGFIVLKRLPETIIGRTCLSTYPDDDRHFFPTKRSYGVNLFGLQLKVQTLAFQEQDSVAAACATSTLWTVLNGTGMLFHHQIPSPLEITRKATEGMPILRTVPNSGLNLIQMANAIRHVGLEPLLFEVVTGNFLKRTVRSYVDFGIPLVLLVAIRDDLHAVAITGYSLPKKKVKVKDFIADRIDEVYVHDDQIGPFAHMKFDGTATIKNPDGTEKKRPWLISPKWGKVVALNIIIPVYHKVRINHICIYNLLAKVESAIETHQPGVSWDVRLCGVNEIKKEVLQHTNISNEYRREILLEKMPRFLWKATAYSPQGIALMDLLFDATDIEQGKFFVRAIEYDALLAKTCQDLSGEISSITEDFYKGVFEWFKNAPSPQIPQSPLVAQ